MNENINRKYKVIKLLCVILYEV